MCRENLVVVRGGGDLATGVVQKLHRAGFHVVILESPQPTAIRRTVALCEAQYDGTARVEDITCRKIIAPEEAEACFTAGEVPLLADAACESLAALRPAALVDAILAKRNLGTRRDMAPVTVALGPGFVAGRDVDAVVETMRGHDLGRLLLEGGALPNTGVPGEIGGQSAKRVLHAAADGTMQPLCAIGDVVQQGQPVLAVGETVQNAPFTGLVRGMLRPGLAVKQGMKIADIDPRCDVDVTTISDKARCLGGAALEAILYLQGKAAKA